MERTDKSVKVIAHRGASLEEPENTLKAIKRALEIGVDWIEIDVQLSSDGVPVVIHDETLCRTTNAEKGLRIRSLESNQVKVYDAGAWFHGMSTEVRVPTLDEVLKLDFGSTGLMIEIKDDIKHDLSHAVFSLLGECSLKDLVIGSFSAESLSFFHKKYPRYELIGILDNLDKLVEFSSLEIDHLAIDHELLNEKQACALTKRYSEVWAFAVDQEDRVRQLIELGVNGIITNDPKMCKTYANRD